MREWWWCGREQWWCQCLGNGGPDGGDLGADAVDSVNDVGAGLAEDGEQNSAFAVQVAGGANVLNGIDDVGDIGEVDRGAFVIPDDDGFKVRGMGHLIVGDDIGGGDAVGDLALGEIGILEAENGLDVGHRQAIAGELGGFTSTRTEGSAPPPTFTWPTP